LSKCHSALILAKHPALDAKDSKGKTPLQCAVDNRHPEAADLLRQAGASEVVLEQPESASERPTVKP
jgi:ankyrin repeat protein